MEGEQSTGGAAEENLNNEELKQQVESFKKKVRDMGKKLNEQKEVAKTMKIASNCKRKIVRKEEMNREVDQEVLNKGGIKKRIAKQEEDRVKKEEQENKEENTKSALTKKINNGFTKLWKLQDKKLEDKDEVEEVGRVDGKKWQMKWVETRKKWEEACEEKNKYKQLYEAEKEKDRKESEETWKKWEEACEEKNRYKQLYEAEKEKNRKELEETLILKAPSLEKIIPILKQRKQETFLNEKIQWSPTRVHFKEKYATKNRFRSRSSRRHQMEDNYHTEENRRSFMRRHESPSPPRKMRYEERGRNHMENDIPRRRNKSQHEMKRRYYY